MTSDQLMTLLDRYFQPERAFMTVLAIAALQYAILVIYLFGGSPDFVLGGDFIAFWSAAREALDGGLTGLYAPDGLFEAMQAHRAGGEVDGLTWQYPPHASLVFGLIGYLPFSVAYGLWCALGLAAFATVLIKAGITGRWLFAALATIPVLTVLNTGQNALFTGSLMMLAVFYAKPNPVLAGLAAALLTIKPQLGILLPVFFIAGGYWRAFGVAAFGSLLLMLVSVGVFGPEAWTAFFAAVGSVSGSVSDGVMPLFKMVNVYAAARLIWLPDAVAMGLAAATILLSIGLMVWTARRTSDPRCHYAVLASATLLAAPYSMYYELVLLVPAIIIVLQRGAKTGWIAGERECVAGLILLTVLVPGPAVQFGISISFLAAALVALIVYRRMRADLTDTARAPQPMAEIAAN